MPTPGLNVSVHAAPFKGANKTASVAVTVQVEGERLGLKETGETYTNALEISMMAMDFMGKVPDGDRANLDLKLRKQTRDLMTQAGIRSVATLDLPPGRYQLRVAAREANDAWRRSVAAHRSKRSDGMTPPPQSHFFERHSERDSLASQQFRVVRPPRGRRFSKSSIPGIWSFFRLCPGEQCLKH